MVIHLFVKLYLKSKAITTDTIVEGYEEFGEIGEALLTPTKIYAKPVMEMHQRA